MKQAAPKRYAHAYLRHFIIFSLFLPMFYSHYQHDYYQDIFPASILAALFIINIVHKWTLDFRRNRPCVIALAILLVLYNSISFYNYYSHPGVHFWKTYQLNITIAFLFFLTLLTIKEEATILSDKVIRFAICTIVINNLVALAFRLFGIRRIQMMNLWHYEVPVEPDNSAMSWLFYEPGEYALMLLLGMAFFIVYKHLFRNIWTYLLSQTVLLVCLFLTQSKTALLAVAFLFGGALLHFVLNKFEILKEYILYSIPIVITITGGILLYLFKQVEFYIDKYFIWKGTWELILEEPLGFRSTFGPHGYEVDFIPYTINHAQNVFINHMLRYSLPVGIVFAIMFAVIILMAFLRKPNYMTFGIWMAILIMMNLEYSLQTVYLPFVLFMIYCIFFRRKVRTPNRNDIADKQTQAVE